MEKLNRIDFFNPPEISLEELEKKFAHDTLFIIEDILSTTRYFNIIFQGIIDIFKYRFEYEEYRNRGITFKFKKTDKKEIVLQMRHFLANLVIWEPFIKMDRVDMLDETYIMDFGNGGEDKMVDAVCDYIDNKILPIHDGDFYSKNKFVDEICFKIKSISNAFGLLMGYSVSIYDTIQMVKRIPELRTLMFDNIDETLQPVEIEEELTRRTNRMLELITEDEIENDFKAMIVSGKNISFDQFRELYVRIGLEADYNGNTIPLIINKNYAITGLDKPSELYIKAGGSRKAAMQQKISMAHPGAFSKKLNQLTTSASVLRKDFEECNSVITIDYIIHTDEHLKYLNGRYYYDARGYERCVDYKRDKYLIGKIIPFRSPMTCNSKEGICKKCYGNLFEYNMNMFSVGALASTVQTEGLAQAVLGSKHTRKTVSNEISFPENLNEILEFQSNEIILRDTGEDLDLYIQFVNMEVEEQDDSEIYYCTQFKIIDINGKELYNVQENNGSNMLLGDKLISLYKRAKDKTKPISLEDIDDTDTLLLVEVKSKELTEPIKMMNKILNSKDKMGARNISELAQIFAEALMSIGSKYDFVHAECILKGLIRSKSNILEYPDWSYYGDPDDYEILRLTEALFNNPSALISLSFGDIRRQLIKPNLYKKTAPSHIDALWVQKLSEFLEDDDQSV